MIDLPQPYLITPRWPQKELLTHLESVMAHGKISCVLYQSNTRDEILAKKQLQEVAAIVQPKGAALLVEAGEDPLGATRLAIGSGADGVHFRWSEAKILEQAINQLKPNFIVGIGGLKCRDAAMRVGELGVDYLMFGEEGENCEKTYDLVSWWSEIFNVPVVAFAKNARAFDHLLSAGCEFLAIGEYFFSDSQAYTRALSMLTAKDETE